MQNNRLHFILIFTLLLISGKISAQEVLLASFLEKIEQEFSVTFNYNVDTLTNEKLTRTPELLSLDEALSFLRLNTPFLYRLLSDRIITVLPQEQRILCGYIRDKDTGEVISRAFINNGSSYTYTDVQGYFELTLGQKKFITVNASDYSQAIFEEDRTGQNLCSNFYLSRASIALESVELSSYIVRGINKLRDGSYDIEFNSFSLLPGLVETDVLLATQALPGIQSTDETVSNINIRGGSNDQNLLLWDDIKMYQSGHFFGLISAFNPNITQKASIVKNGTQAAYTDGVSGTIAMKTDDKISQKTSGSIGAGMLSLDGFLDLPLSKKSSLQIALRHSINGFLKTPTYDSYFTRISQETEVSSNEENIVKSNQDFSFYDGSLRWLYEISPKDKLRVNFLVIGNDLSFTESAITANGPDSRNSNIAQNSISGGVYYEHTWNKMSKTHFQFYETNYKLKAINANIFANQRLLQENTVSESSVRLQHDLKKNEQWRFSGGYHFTETGITDLNDVDRPVLRELVTEVVRSHALFGQGYYTSNSNKLNTALGLRTSYLDKFNRVLVEPRFTMSYRLSKAFTVQALGELKHQTTSQIITLQNDFLGIERRRWQLTNEEDIPVIQSKQASVGLSYKRDGWLIDAISYIKTVDGITTQSQGFDTKYEFARTNGRYDVFGVDFLLRKNMGSFNTWLSYGFMNNQYTFNELEESTFPSNFDITHSIKVGTTYQNKGWKFSSGLNWHSGQPSTKPANQNNIRNGQIVYAAANSTKLRDYLRIDSSVIYDIIKNDKIRLETGVSLWNVLNTQNTIGTFYRIMGDSVNSFDETALGITLNANLRLHF